MRARSLLLTTATLAGGTVMGPKETGGRLVGAGAGRLAGSQFGGGAGSGALIRFGVMAQATQQGPCRELQQWVAVGGRSEQADGSWRGVR